MAVMIVPFVLMLVQIESRFAFRVLEPGERALLTLTLDGELPPSELPITLALPDGVVQETPPLRIDSTGEVVWRLRAARSGTHELAIEVGEHRILKRVLVGSDGAGGATHLYRASHPGTLLYPQEPPLASDGPARGLALSYPRARSAFAGLSSAAWSFFAASILFGYALRSRFGVTF